MIQTKSHRKFDVGARQVSVIVCLVCIFTATSRAQQKGARRAGGVNEQRQQNLKVEANTTKINLKVVDEKGVPIEGVIVTPKGFTNTQKNITSAWLHAVHGKPVSAQSDVNGLVTLQYPKVFEKNVETEAVFCDIEHPEYATTSDTIRFFGVSESRSTIVLERGGSLEIKAKNGETGDSVHDFKLLVSSKRIEKYGEKDETADTLRPYKFWWNRRDDGSLSSKRIPPGKTYLRVVYFPEKGPRLYSDVVTYSAKRNTTYRKTIDLRPGVRVEGELDEGVKRPVRNGKIFAYIFPKIPGEIEAEGTRLLEWRESTSIAEDGTFVFESLPRDGRMYVHAFSEGYISTSFHGAFLDRSSQQVPLNDKKRYAVFMEATGQCEVRLTDKNEAALAHADVSVITFLRWGDSRFQILTSMPWFDTADVLKKGHASFATGRRAASRKWAREIGLAGKTNKNGVALLPNVPPGKRWMRFHHVNSTDGGDRDGKYDTFNARIVTGKVTHVQYAIE